MSTTITRTGIDAGPDESTIDPGNFSAQFRLLNVSDVTMAPDREIFEENVEKMMESMALLGGRLQLQPILVTHDLRLVAGGHRLTAARRSGWSHIGAMVIAEGLSPEALRFLEFEENRARRIPSPIELLEGFEKYVEPIVRAEAQKARLQNLKQSAPVTDARLSCIGDDESQPEPQAESPTPEVSIRRAVQEYTGFSPDTLTKIRDVRDIAADESAPALVRQAAAKSVRELEVPGAKIAPAHRRVVYAQQMARLEAEDPRALEQQRLRDVLDRVLKDTSLLAERMQADLGSDLRRAVAEDDVCADQDLRAVQTALTQSLAQVAAIVHERNTTNTDHSAAFFELGVQLQQLAVDALDSFGGTR